MATKNETVEVTVEELNESRATRNGAAVTLDTTSLVDGERHPTTIEVAHDDLPAVAVALMNPSTAAANAGTPGGDVLPAALWCLAAGVIEDGATRGVRIHLQFDSGQVLPVEMPVDAAAALLRGLTQHLNPPHPPA